jgi:hypothetical protein
MKKFFMLFACILVSFILNAQSSIGTVKPNTQVLFNGGDNAFIGDFVAGKFEIACINTTEGKITQTTITPLKSSFSNSFFIVGKNHLYLIEESADRSKNGMYNDLKITAWDGKENPVEYNFFGQLNNSRIKYAIANDEEIYFLTDEEPTTFDERSIYAGKHSIARFSRNDIQFKNLKYNLSSNMETAFTSFWFPLRIGKDFCEWYRTKAINTRLFFEVQRIDKSGVLLAAKEFELGLYAGVPPGLPDLPDRTANIYFNYDAFTVKDTSLGQQVYSMLATAILQYNDEMGKYFTSAKSYTPTDIYIQGVYYMILDDQLNVVAAYEDPEVIKNNILTASLPKFMNTEYRIAFNKDGDPFLSVYYSNWSKKTVAEKHYELKAGKWQEVQVSAGLKRLNGNIYPGFSIDKVWRSNTLLKSDLLQAANFAYNGKGMIFILPKLKTNNVYFVK